MMSPLRGLALAAVLLAPIPASAAILVQIDKSSQRMTVSQDGRALYTWPVSTGKRGHSTPSGSFKTFRMEKDHFSREWDDAPMPNSIFFTKVGHAIHGTFDVKRLGTPASHGCVRLAPENAAVLFAMVKADGVFNTQVVLTGVEPAPLPSQNVPVARAPQNQNENYVARNAPPNDAIDNQVYGDSRLPPPTYQPRAPADDQRYANEPQQPAYRQPPAYRQQQPYGQQYYPPQPQPYYGSRYRDPYYDSPPPPPANYRRGFFSYGWN